MTYFDDLKGNGGRMTISNLSSEKLKAFSLNDQHLASAFYERLVEYITAFEKGLNEEEEIGARLVSFGENILIHINDIGYYNPSLIRFDGITNKGERVQLVQHVNQINVLFIAVKKIDQNRIRIGFKLQQRMEGTEE